MHGCLNALHVVVNVGHNAKPVEVELLVCRSKFIRRVIVGKNVKYQAENGTMKRNMLDKALLYHAIALANRNTPNEAFKALYRSYRLLQIQVI